jgi:hypothetical protein
MLLREDVGGREAGEHDTDARYAWDPQVVRASEVHREWVAWLEAGRDFVARDARARYGRNQDDWDMGRDADTRNPHSLPFPGLAPQLPWPAWFSSRCLDHLKDSGTEGRWSMLTKTNYSEWSMVIKVKMQVQHMWEAVWYSDADFTKAQRALEALLAAVPPEMAPTLADKETAKDACDAIADARIGSDLARRATL